MVVAEGNVEVRLEAQGLTEISEEFGQIEGQTELAVRQAFLAGQGMATNFDIETDADVEELLRRHMSNRGAAETLKGNLAQHSRSVRSDIKAYDQSNEWWHAIFGSKLLAYVQAKLKRENAGLSASKQRRTAMFKWAHVGVTDVPDTIEIVDEKAAQDYAMTACPRALTLTVVIPSYVLGAAEPTESLFDMAYHGINKLWDTTSEDFQPEIVADLNTKALLGTLEIRSTPGNLSFLVVSTITGEVVEWATVKPAYSKINIKKFGGKEEGE